MAGEGQRDHASTERRLWGAEALPGVEHPGRRQRDEPRRDTGAEAAQRVDHHIGVPRVVVDADLAAGAHLGQHHVRNGLAGRHVHARCERLVLPGRPDRQVARRRRRGRGDVERDRIALARYATPTGDLEVEPLAGTELTEEAAGAVAGVEQARGSQRLQSNVAAGREVPHHVADQMHRAGVVEEVDRATDADAREHEVRDGGSRHGVEVRRERSHLAARRHRDERGSCRLDRRQVDGNSDGIERNAVLAGDGEPPGLTPGERRLTTTGAVAGVEHSLGGRRDEAARRRGRQHDDGDVSPSRARRAGEQAEILEVPVEDRATAATEPPIEHRSDHRTEVDVRGQPVPLIESGEGGALTVEAAFHPRSHHEQRGRGAMVGATRLVRPRRATELRHRHDRHPVAIRRRQGAVERGDRRVEVAQEIGMVRVLIVVVVETVETDVDHAQTDVGIDQPGGDRHLLRQVAIGQGLHERRCDVVGEVQLSAHRGGEHVVPLAPTRSGVGHGSDTVVHPQVLDPGVDSEHVTPRRDADGAPFVAQKVQCHRRIDRRYGELGLVGGDAVEPAPDPPGGRSTRPEASVHPDRHRGEMRQVGVRVPHALYDRHLATLIHRVQVRKAGVEADLPVDRQHLVGRHGDVAALLVVVAVSERHDGVQPVVAAVQHDRDEDAVGRPDRRTRERVADLAPVARDERFAHRAGERSAAETHADGLQETTTGPSAGPDLIDRSWPADER